MKNEMKYLTSILFAVLLISVFLPTFGAYGEKVYFDKDEPYKVPKNGVLALPGKEIRNGWLLKILLLQVVQTFCINRERERFPSALFPEFL